MNYFAICVTETKIDSESLAIITNSGEHLQHILSQHDYDKIFTTRIVQINEEDFNLCREIIREE